MRGNYKKAIKLLNSVTSENLDFKYVIFIITLKEYLKLSAHYGTNIFIGCRSSGESSAVLYYNNMACLHLSMGKPNLACFYLRKALHENKCALESVQTKDSGNYNGSSLFSYFVFRY